MKIQESSFQDIHLILDRMARDSAKHQAVAEKRQEEYKKQQLEFNERQKKSAKKYEERQEKSAKEYDERQKKSAKELAELRNIVKEVSNRCDTGNSYKFS